MFIIPCDSPSISPFIFPSIKPKFIKMCICNWTLKFLSYHILAHPSVELFSSCADLAKFCRAHTTKWFGSTWFIKFPIPRSPNHPCDWWYISKILIWSTYINMLFEPAPVFTMNAMLPLSYLLARLIKWSIIYFAFETKI